MHQTQQQPPQSQPSPYSGVTMPPHHAQMNGHSPMALNTMPPAPIASTTQNPSTNTFYASATVPPPPNLGDMMRPHSRSSSGPAQHQYQHQLQPNNQESPGTNAGVKPKAGQTSAPPPAQPPRSVTPSQAADASMEYQKHVTHAPASPNKGARGGKTRGRGRGRGGG